MKEIDKIEVSIQFAKDVVSVGLIIKENKRYFFKYDSYFLKVGYNISPFKLKFDNSIQVVETNIFDGLFGVFADSQPDGWGRLLMDRFLLNQGWSLSDIDPLVRLSLVGNEGIGALKYTPIFDDNFTKHTFEGLDSIYRKSLDIYNDDFTDLDLIYQLGGSSGGARPKIWINFNKSLNAFSYNRKEGFEPWIIKFPSSMDTPNIALVEYVYYQMAKEAGIQMSESLLFRGDSGIPFFGTKRFDVSKGKRNHMISAAGLTHDNYRLTALDYGHLMDAAFKLTASRKSYEEVLRLGIFNVLSNNKDDHSKNFSFLMNEKGQWRFSPAYDLTYSTSSHGYQSTTVNDKSKDITYNDFKVLANIFGVKSLDSITGEVINALMQFKKKAKDISLPKESRKMIGRDIKKNIKSFGFNGSP